MKALHLATGAVSVFLFAQLAQAANGAATTSQVNGSNPATDTSTSGAGPTSDSSYGTSQTGTTGARTMGDTNMDLSSQVRQDLLSDSSLSTQARAAQVTTQGDQVIIKGTAASQEEKSKVEEVVRQSAGNMTVDNQMVVR
jgi:osmotically-inducible protein OsmY